MSDTKADFSSIYDRDDPRAYFAELSPLDYQIPQQAMPVLRTLAGASTRSGRTRPVLDLCCSYGINGGLLRFDVELDEMSARATAAAAADLSPRAFIASERAFFAERRRTPQLDVRGLDAAPHAIGYAREVGLVTDGWAENLEQDAASPALRAGLRDVGLVTCTGGVGYVGAATFDAILDAVDRPDDLWLAVFVLRVFDYTPIEQVLRRAGLVTEQVPGRTFLQRRFADAEEQRVAVETVRDRGLDPAGKEADGWFHAECFVTRPAAEAARVPLEDLLAG
ncbi:hypothetical protein [uncultured Jatrophihabitans sp.]|uniref:hypothetical protein n=1 Tax=uncultured Jatrophihabitans sp. TaxID=1610747 RepID=UPI0035CC6C47